MITMDEIGMWQTGDQSDSLTPNHDSLRGQVLWGTLLSGAAGVEWYFGANNRYHDLNTEDWRSRDRLWELTGYALSFFQEHLPYWEMQPNHDLIDIEGAYCYQKPGEIYAVYLPEKNQKDSSKPVAASIDLSATQNTFQVQWFDPLKGGQMQDGSVKTIKGGGETSLGFPPFANQDCVVLLTAIEN
jgi:hypothetical protein